MAQGRRQVWNDDRVRKLKPQNDKRTTYPDPELPGHYARVTPSGAISYAAVAIDPVTRKQVWHTIGDARVLSVEDARQRARDALTRIRSGQSPKPIPQVRPASFEAVAANWLQRHVVAKGLRSEREIRRILRTYVQPAWGTRDFEGINRADVATLLDRIEDENGLRQADAVLRILRGLSNWYASRSHSYLSPFVRGMRRGPAAKRDRTLTDDEIRSVWAACEKAGTYGRLVRLALLLGQRRSALASIRWAEVKDGLWTPSREKRSKGIAQAIALPPMARAIIESQLRIAENPFVFAGRGGTHFGGWSKSKAALNALLPTDMPDWTIHDCRRTARTLLSRAGIGSDIAERVLGHTIAGVEGVYDRHTYQAEIGDALLKLEGEIKKILRKRTRSAA